MRIKLSKMVEQTHVLTSEDHRGSGLIRDCSTMLLAHEALLHLAEAVWAQQWFLQKFSRSIQPTAQCYSASSQPCNAQSQPNEILYTSRCRCSTVRADLWRLQNLLVQLWRHPHGVACFIDMKRAHAYTIAQKHLATCKGNIWRR